jgi:putative acetyltransferase
MKIAIGVEPFDSPDARRLVEALDAHLAGRYKPEHRFGPHLKAEHVAPWIGTFVVARAEGKAVGCGALRRRDPTTVEVKRMYVEPEMRGRGIAMQILEHLASTARTMGGERLVLETGIHQATGPPASTRSTVSTSTPAYLPACASKKPSRRLGRRRVEAPRRLVGAPLDQRFVDARQEVKGRKRLGQI